MCQTDTMHQPGCGQLPCGSVEGIVVKAVWIVALGLVVVVGPSGVLGVLFVGAGLVASLWAGPRRVGFVGVIVSLRAGPRRVECVMVAGLCPCPGRVGVVGVHGVL